MSDNPLTSPSTRSLQGKQDYSYSRLLYRKVSGKVRFLTINDGG